MSIKKVGVVGFTGVMGAGIVQLCAQSGYEVVGFSRNPERTKKAVALIEKHLSRLVEKEKISASDKAAALARISTADNMSALGDCDLVIESVVENMDLKKSIFAELDAACHPDAILATNTSSLSIIDLAMATRRPNQVLGLHFFNPAPLMPLLEVVKTIATSDETLAIGKGFGETLNKTIIVARDAPGYIVNTLLIPYLLNAIRMLDRGQAAREDIDTAIKSGLNYPMGPLQVADYIGLDALLFIANIMYEESKEPQYAAPPLLKKMVTAGWLGRKSGKGFYEYR
ncbi:3-hydroxybutyryl-CoA dehydrogenase [Dehalogenimonas etheniformans]|uniref:3-hydroxybutyryl-CoA dehydrogenase n=1 Tax=Dehalogenimonas etheniformans TaxID=1536648 RepID=A0A2P5P5C4_9CHLR|nr:3-hydroxybutyryl-CoA dehydrogenase [Dehalogenimonas etheniformans]PPD57490.1 3-hydroxybutyryl-CoA dehydrogenase [Dehalogenimonas etheniformans]